MSQANVETCKRAVDAGNRRDLEALTAEFDPDVEWHSAVAGLGTTVYRGHEGVRELFRDAGEAFASTIFEVNETRDLGDRVLALGRLRSRGHESGAETEVSFNQLAGFKHGRVIRLWTFLDPAAALEAAGLSGQPISAENLELALRQVDAVNRRDAQAFVATLSPNVEWEDALFWSDVTRVYRGWVEVREWFNQVVIEPWESLECGIEELAEGADDRFLFGGLLTARGRDGVETQLRFWTVIWTPGGTVTKRQVFLERAEAFEAAGLRE